MKTVNFSYKLQITAIMLFLAAAVFGFCVAFAVIDYSAFALTASALSGAIFLGVIVYSLILYWNGTLCVVGLYEDRIEWRKHFRKIVVYSDDIAIDRIKYGNYFGMSGGLYGLYQRFVFHRPIAYYPYFVAFTVRDKRSGSSLMIAYYSIGKFSKLAACPNRTICKIAEAGIEEYKRCVAQSRKKSGMYSARGVNDGENGNLRIMLNKEFFYFVMAASAVIVACLLAIIALAVFTGPEWEVVAAMSAVLALYVLAIAALFATNVIKTVTLESSCVKFRRGFKKIALDYDRVEVRREDKLKHFPRFGFCIFDPENVKHRIKLELNPEQMQALFPACNGTDLGDALKNALDEWEGYLKNSVFTSVE